MKHPLSGSGGKGGSQRSVDKEKFDKNHDNIEKTLKPSRSWETAESKRRRGES